MCPDTSNIAIQKYDQQHYDIMQQMFYKLQQKVENWFGHVFEIYGRFVARNPLKIILLVVFINIGLGFGLLRLEQESGIEQYTPTDSTASKNRDQIRELFTIDTAVNYYQQSLPDLGLFASVIIERKDGGNILDSSLWADLTALYDFINTTTAHDSTIGSFTYVDICAKRSSACVVEGDLIFSTSFLADMGSGTISFQLTFTKVKQSILIE
ncbi:unnamed protein product [Mytilus edulis]|uniref:Uncharacterized protein n=1 Tax=Mytilus edulis TaxID=6550 RepID=A0A8S3TI47_MYTED|nr:unnamed protein product [Mytilus edulis]